jgi:hypothetical protein
MIQRALTDVGEILRSYHATPRQGVFGRGELDPT